MGIILASASPRRRELLEMLGISFRVVPSDAEASPAGLPPGDTAAETARSKAEDIALKFPDDIIIAADTLVYAGETVLGKPRNPAQAAEFLHKLSGRIHEVFTGVCICEKGKREIFYERTAVRFRELSGAEISGYISTGEPMDKAGAYGAQGRGALFISAIEGDFFNVMGLPLCALGAALRKFGVSIL